MGQTRGKKQKSKAGRKDVMTKAANKLFGKNGGKKRRMTPESLSKKILVEKLKKRLFKIKYGGGR